MYTWIYILTPIHGSIFLNFFFFAIFINFFFHLQNKK